MRVTRRQVLSFGSAALLTNPVRSAVAEYGLYVPGYRAADAIVDGIPAIEHPVAARNLPRGYDGPTTLVTRIGLTSRRVDHAVFPVQGHVVVVDRRVGTALLHAQSRDWSVAFDPETMDMASISLAFASGFTGGGHAQLIDGGKTALTVERAPYGPYLGAPEKHYGRVTLRDAQTLGTVQSISTFGILPHDLHVLDDDRMLVIANYGNLAPRNCRGAPPDHTIEPSVTFVDLMSGKLLDKVVLPSGGAEIRHLAAADRSRVLAIQVDQGSGADLIHALGT